MLKILRDIHLISGFALLVSVLMYVVTGVVMQHEERLPRHDPEKSTWSEPCDGIPGAATDPDEVARMVQDRYRLPGQRWLASRGKDGSWSFIFRHPGDEYRATIPADGATIAITRTRVDAVGVANAMHRLKGYRGGVLYVVWATLFDLSAVAFIVFPLTGVALWFLTTRRRLGGWAVLAATSAFTIAVATHLARGF